MGAFSTRNGTMTIVKEKSPATFEVEQNCNHEWRTVTFDSKTGHLLRCPRNVVRRHAATRRRKPRAQGTAAPGSFTIRMIGEVTGNPRRSILL